MSLRQPDIIAKKILTGLLLLLVFVFQSAGQALNPAPDKIYRPDELTWVFLTMSPADKAFLQDPANVLSEVYVQAVFRMKNSQMDTILAKNVGVKLRGKILVLGNKYSGLVVAAEVARFNFLDFPGPRTEKVRVNPCGGSSVGQASRLSPP